MDEDQAKRNNLLDTTDCLEAVGVFRGWKNFLFVITIGCLLLLQVSFWLVNTGYVKADDDAKCKTPPVIAEDANQITQSPEEPNQPAVPASQQKTSPLFGIKVNFKCLAWFIRFLNFVLIPAAALYCLTMLFSLKISLLGRLGGINHISRAFFLSMVLFVLLLPWQRVFFFTDVIAGAIYTPDELLSRYTAVKISGIFGTISYYWRFCGYSLLVLLLLIFSQFRSARWAKAILRRLEVI